MAIADSLKSVQLITEGTVHRTGVFHDIDAWENLLTWIEGVTDTQLAANALREIVSSGGRARDEGWIAWESGREDGFEAQ